MSQPVIGVDLGGTNIKAGLVSPEGEVQERHSIPTRAEEGPKAVASRICRAARETLQRAECSARAVEGIGVGSPGTIDLENGIVTFSPNLPGWHDIPLRRMVQERMDLPCTLENDANAAALGEQWMGAGQGAPSLVLLTLGTGIGGGIVLGGRVWHGVSGVAGEIGHMSIDPQGPKCGCGNRGCLEAHASATAMVRRLREAVEAGATTSLADELQQLTAKDIHEAAVAGDALARENIEMTGRYLGVGVSNIMHILNPAVVVFSGGVCGAGQMLMKPVLEEVEWRTMEDSRREVAVRFAELPDTAGLIGAARSFQLR